MCLIMTLFAAIVTTAVWNFTKLRKEYKLGVLALMYWGAVFMWTVDGLFCVSNGNSFLTMTTDDAILGSVIIFCGLSAWKGICFINKKIIKSKN